MKLRLPIRRRWLQMSVRTLLLVVVVLCIGLAAWTSRSRRQEAIVRKVIRMGGGYVTYVHEVDAAGKRIPDAPLPGPPWLRRLVGEQAFFQLHSVASNGLDDEDLQVLASFKTLAHLRYGEQISDRGLAHLAALQNLKLIEGDSWKITDRGLKGLAGLERLEFLVLDHSLITDQGLESLAGLQNLKYLNLDNTQVTAQGAARLRERLPQARIDPGMFPSVEEEHEVVQELIQAGVRFRADKDGWIKQVNFIGSNLGDEQLIVAARLQRPQTLFLLNARVTSAGIEQILAVHPDLKVIPPFHTPHAEDRDAVAALERCGARLYYDTEGHVRDVQLTDEGLRDADIVSLRGLTRLKGITIFSPLVTDEGLRSFEACMNLETLYLTRASLSNAGLQRLKGVEHLKHLAVEGTGISDEGLSAIQDLQRLSRLTLRDTSITGRGFVRLTKLVELEHLILSGSPIDDAGLALLPKLPRLKLLSLASTAVTDDGLEHLKGLEALEQLTLTGTAVTDIGLQRVPELPSLKLLKLEHTGVTQSAAERFQEQRPTCKVRR